MEDEEIFCGVIAEEFSDLYWPFTMHQSPEELHTAPDSVPVLRHIGAYEAPRGKDYPPHHHDNWELVFYRRGFIEAPIDGEIYRTRPGLLLLTSPNTIHAERATTGYANIYAMFTAAAQHPSAYRV